MKKFIFITVGLIYSFVIIFVTVKRSVDDANRRQDVAINIISKSIVFVKEYNTSFVKNELISKESMKIKEQMSQLIASFKKDICDKTLVTKISKIENSLNDLYLFDEKLFFMNMTSLSLDITSFQKHLETTKPSCNLFNIKWF